jgi:hypothetical protein
MCPPEGFRELSGSPVEELIGLGCVSHFISYAYKNSVDSSPKVIPIIGARKLTQLQDNLASLDLELSAEHPKSLEEASRVELDFPQDLYAIKAVGAIRYGGMRDRILVEDELATQL